MAKSVTCIFFWKVRVARLFWSPLFRISADNGWHWKGFKKSSSISEFGQRCHNRCCVRFWRMMNDSCDRRSWYSQIVIKWTACSFSLTLPFALLTSIVKWGKTEEAWCSVNDYTVVSLKVQTWWCLLGLSSRHKFLSRYSPNFQHNCCCWLLQLILCQLYWKSLEGCQPQKI